MQLTACATPPERLGSPEERALRADEFFESFDLNGDGYLSRSELEGGLRYLAMGLNTTGSGSHVMLGLRQKTKSKKKSSQRTPSLTREEVNRAVHDAFVTRDSDLDERLSRAEFKKLIVERPSTPGVTDIWEPFM